VPFILIIPSSYLIHDQKWEKKAKKSFLDLSLHSTQNAYYGPKNYVQPSNDITHYALHPHDPTHLTKGSSQPLIYDQKWQRIPNKQVFSTSASTTKVNEACLQILFGHFLSQMSGFGGL
jgi:hypothetical protein